MSSTPAASLSIHPIPASRPAWRPRAAASGSCSPAAPTTDATGRRSAWSLRPSSPAGPPRYLSRRPPRPYLKGGYRQTTHLDPTDIPHQSRSPSGVGTESSSGRSPTLLRVHSLRARALQDPAWWPWLRVEEERCLTQCSSTGASLSRLKVESHGTLRHASSGDRRFGAGGDRNLFAILGP